MLNGIRYSWPPRHLFCFVFLIMQIMLVNNVNATAVLLQDTNGNMDWSKGCFASLNTLIRTKNFWLGIMN